MAYKYSMFLCLLLIFACTKEPTWQEECLRRYDVVLSNLKFDCNDGVVSQNYFSGNINHDTVCYNDGLHEYISWLGLGWKAITTEPVLNTATTQSIGRFLEIGFVPLGNNPFIERLTFRIVGFPSDMLYENIADSFFRVGSVPLLDLSEVNGQGIEARIVSRYQEEGSTGLEGFTISSAQGDQPPETRIEFTKVKRVEYDDRIEYSIELKANCLLYHSLHRGENQFFGELKNGSLVATYSFPHGI